MRNQLIQLFIHKETIGKTTLYTHFGILETPCYPCSWYFGPIRCDEGEWNTLNNATHLYHDSLEKARTAAKKMKIFLDF